MSTNWVGSWAGGRIAQTRGRQVYYLERTRNGKRVTIRLAVQTAEQANLELGLFERDPAAYKLAASGPPPGSVPTISREEIGRYVDFLRSRGRAPQYVRGMELYLFRWGRVFEGRDVRTLKVREINDALKTWDTGHGYRINALKGFYTFLAREQVIKPDENVGALLTIEKYGAAKLSRSQVYTMAQVERAYAATPRQMYRDSMILRAKTGMHHTEIDRIARGEGEIIEVDGGTSGIAAVVRFVHRKKRKEHRISLDAQGLAAAKRLIARGRAPAKMSISKVVDTVEAITGERILYARLRHSLATWAVERGKEVTLSGEGLRIDRVAQLLGHGRNIGTTATHYVDTVPPMVWVPINLVHPDDPPIGAKAPLAEVVGLNISRAGLGRASARKTLS